MVSEATAVDVRIQAAIIGAIVSLVVTLLAPWMTFRHNRKLEEQKHLRAKKEELYIELDKLKKELFLKYTDLCNAHKGNHKKYYDTYEKDGPNSVSKVMMLISLYFPSMRMQSTELMVRYEAFIKSYIHIYDFDAMQLSKEQSKLFLLHSQRPYNMLMEYANNLQKQVRFLKADGTQRRPWRRAIVYYRLASIKLCRFTSWSLPRISIKKKANQ